MEDNFGHWLERMMADRNWTHAQMSRETGISEAHISRLANSVRTPGVDVCKKIADAFGVSALLVFNRAGLIEPQQNLLSPLCQEICNLLVELPEWVQKMVLIQVRALQRSQIEQLQSERPESGSGHRLKPTPGTKTC